MKKIFFPLILALFANFYFASLLKVSAADFYSVVNGNWNTPGTWSATSGGTPHTTLTPGASDNVIIERGIVVTVTANAGCTALTLQNSNPNGTTSTLQINSGFTLAVGGNVVFSSGSSTRKCLLNLIGTLSVTGDLTIDNNSNSTLDMSNGGAHPSSKLNITGSFTKGTSGIFTSGNASTVDFNRSGVQTVPGLSFYSITLSGSDAKTATGATVNGILSLQGTATATGTSPIFGAASTLEYAGTSAQNSTSVEFPSSGGPFNLKINNGNGVTLHAPRSISGTATFTNGVLSTSATNLLTINSGGAVSGASNSSFVDGPMAKVGSTAFTFPVGKTGTGYQPCGISSISVSTTFTAQYFRGTPPDKTSLNAPLAAISACEYWNIRASSSVAVHITLYWNANSGCGSGAYIPGNYPYPALRIARHRPATTDWINASNNNSQDPSSVSSNGNMTTELASGSFTTPNYFTFGTTDGSQIPLPVKFGTIKAFEKQKGVQIEWNTYSEKNVDRFEIQRSADGQSFASIGHVNAKNTESRSDYGWYDSNPLLDNFYRIKSVDIDAKSDYTSIVKVSFGKALSGISIYPNPVIGKQVSFQAADLQKGNYIMTIYSNNGQHVHMLSIVHEGGSISQTIVLPTSLQSGMYRMQLNGVNIKISKPFIIQ